MAYGTMRGRLPEMSKPHGDSSNAGRCGLHNRVDGVPPKRSDLAFLRSSEESSKCRNCEAEMDTMTAFVGERVGKDTVP
jgi:hypothetical protein